jgi:hypothetical protein
VAPEPQSHALTFDPNGPGMGLDVDFNNFDLGDIDAINVGRDIAHFGLFNNFGLDVNNYITNFAFEDTLKDAELSVGPHASETLQEPDTSSLSHLVPPYEKTDAALTRVTVGVTLPDASEFNLPVDTSAHLSNEMSDKLRAQKRKKIDEVDKCRILPEGSRRNRNKTARARGLDSLA